MDNSRLTSAISLWCLALSCILTNAVPSAFEFGVVIDAGSSGSRVRVYRWPQRTRERDIPAVSEIFNYKVKPGLSAITGGRENVQPYITRLLNEAKYVVDAAHRETTAIYFMATAGMRMLQEDDANEKMATVDRILSDRTVNPFLYKSLNTRILSGEEEGAFAWIALNYLRGFFSGAVSEHVGVMELGGASAQIAFVPDGSILANKFPVFLDDHEYPLYVHSYLKYGGTATMDTAIEELIEENPGDATLENPCMLEDDYFYTIYEGYNVTIQGTSDPEDCLDDVKEFIYQVEPDLCNPKPCAIGPFYQPSLPENMTFYAVAAFVYTAEDMDQFSGGELLDEDRTFRPDELLDVATDYCRLTISEATEFFGTSDFASTRCHIGIYMPTLLTRAYGFPGDTDRVKVASRINGRPIAWPLGALLYETQYLSIPEIRMNTEEP